MSDETPVSRRQVLGWLGALGVGSLAFQRALATQVAAENRLTAEMIRQSAWIAGLELDEAEQAEVAEALERGLADAAKLRATNIDTDVVPALVFRPDFFYAQANLTDADNSLTNPTRASSDPANSTGRGASAPAANPRTGTLAYSLQDLPRPSDDDLAFASIREQASLLANRQISSRELTTLYLGRLKLYDPVLHCVVTLLEDYAIEQANASDERRAAGNARGILDGIPWVAKDLIAVPPWKTTWGAEPFRDQVRAESATVAQRMQSAGAILLAKVTLGALAWGDRWFGGLTRNPWNPAQGSSGSSAGSASAVAAGLASFALGSETLGSIVSPTRRCRTSGLRPTFGRISRAGCMPLAWSMDKIGPIARYADDLAFVFAHLLGQDGRDPTVVEREFNWPNSQDWRTDNAQLGKLRVGVTGGRLNDTEQQALDYFIDQGARIVEMPLASSLPTDAMSFILSTEAATVFDDAFRADPKADYGNWPATFRESNFTPAVQYLRANRLRSLLIVETEKQFAQVDVILGGNDLLLTNLTGHPSVVVACGEADLNGARVPGVVKLTAAAYRESTLLDIAHRLQSTLPPNSLRPSLNATPAEANE